MTGAHIWIFHTLKAGGNGDCFLGQRSDTGEHVVIKYLREFDLPDARRRFAREVRVLAQRRIRGLMSVLSADTEGPRPYYVMPYLQRGPLSAHAGKLSDEQLRGVASEVATTLAALHAQFVAHGDVKPDNILLADDGHLNLADPLGNGMGCTVLFSENSGGTPGYCAPEICRGAQISQAGDSYSFGATLFHLTTGRAPGPGQRLLVPATVAVSPVIREIVRACCAPEPSARPRMADILRMLRGERWAAICTSRRNWRIAGAIALVGLAAIALDF
jgi:serine/threonine protein kinase